MPPPREIGPIRYADCKPKPIQLDIIVVCRKGTTAREFSKVEEALKSARGKIRRLESVGLRLSRNDRKVVLYGQLMTVDDSGAPLEMKAGLVEEELARHHAGEFDVLDRVPQIDMF